MTNLTGCASEALVDLQNLDKEHRWAAMGVQSELPDDTGSNCVSTVTAYVQLRGRSVQR